LPLNNSPSDLSSGIELNTDGGNMAYLVSNNGGAILGGLSSLTFETTIVDNSSEIIVPISYATAGESNTFILEIQQTSTTLVINGAIYNFSAVDYDLLTDGQQHSLALSWDNTNGDVAVYIDGNLVDSQTGVATGVTLYGNGSDGTLVFGQEQDAVNGSFTPAQQFNGVIYDIRLWNEVRTESEISLDHRHKVDPGSIPSTLIANWQMDGFNASNQITDIVSGNHLSIGQQSIDTWVNQSGGVTANGNTLTFVDDNAPIGFGSQVNSLNVSSFGHTDDYTIRFTLDNETNYSWTVGLGTIENGPAHTDPEYSIYINHQLVGTDSVEIQHNGTTAGTHNIGLSAGGELGFYVNGTILEYQYNGVTFATDTITANTDWYIDTGFFALSDATYGNQDDYSLSDFNLVSGNAPSSTQVSTLVDDLNVNEHSVNGTRVGYIVPTDPDIADDIVRDGLFKQHTIPATFQTFTSPTSFGAWDVTSYQAVVYNDTSLFGWTPLGGRPVELGNVAGPGKIQQTLNTVAGQTYQVTFAFTGDFDIGETTKDLEVTVAGTSNNFSISEPPGWTPLDPVWDSRSITFTATASTTLLSFESLDLTGSGHSVIGDVQITEVPDVINTILNNDSTLNYNAASGKFYKYMPAVKDFQDSLIDVENQVLNSIAGRMLTIGTASENQFISNLITAQGGSVVHLGASDAVTEGEWRWAHNNEQFSNATGASVNGSFVGWRAGEPNDVGGSENYAVMLSDGDWTDTGNASYANSIAEWDADEVISSYTFSLSNDANGRFTIDSNTGEITVADGSQLDYDTNTTHNITAEVTDATGNTYSEVMTIVVNELSEITQVVPLLQTTTENNPLTFSPSSGNAITVSDSTTSSDTRLQVSLSVSPINGTLTLPQTTGLFIIGGSNNTSAMVIEGKESDLNTALDGLVFTPNPNYIGSVDLHVLTALAADLEGHYTFENGQALDQSVGLSQHGTMSGNATTTLDGTRGEVLQLDGDSDNVVVPGNFNNPASVTLAAWINPVINGDDDIISMGDNIGLRVRPDGQIRGLFYDTSGFNVLYSGILIPSGWNHVALTFEDTNKELVLYLNGVEVASQTANGSIDYSRGTDTVIGGHGNGQTTFDYTGLIDDARIYVRALSADDISILAADRADATDTIPITITARPVIDLDADNSNTTGTFFETTFTEGGSPVSIGDLDAILTDADSTSLTSLHVQIVNQPDGIDERLWANIAVPGLSQAYDSSAGLLTISGSASITDYQNALHAVAYDNLSETPDTTQRTLNVTVSDAQSNSSQVQLHIDVIATNDAPVLDTSANFTLNSIQEDSSNNPGQSVANFIATAGGDPITDIEADPEGIAITSASNLNGSWQYSVNGPGGPWNGFPGTSVNNALLLNANTMIRFEPNQDYSGTETITFHAWDQTTGSNGSTHNVSNTGGTTAFSNNSNQATLDITPINDAPVLSTTSMFPVNITENNTASSTDANIAITDIDSPALASAVVSISSNYKAAEDILSYSPQPGITGAWDSASGALTFSGSASVAVYQTLLQSITIENTSDNPDTATRTISWTVSDGTDNSNTLTRSVEITSINDAPLFTLLPTHESETVDSTASATSSVTAADLDNDGNLDLITTSTNTGEIVFYQGDGSGSFDTGTAITNTLDEPQKALAADFDNDGDMDLVVADYSTTQNNVLIYTNDGNESFTSSVLEPATNGAFGIGIGDLDGDGDIDIAANFWSSSEVVWYENLGGGAFNRTVVDTSAGGTSIEIADVNADGEADIIATFRNSNSVAYYQNDGGALSFTSSSYTVSQASDAVVTDIDNDGDKDIGYIGMTGAVGWLENDGASAFVDHQLETTGFGKPIRMSSADYDADGDNDLLVAVANSINFSSVYENKYVIFENDGVGGFTKSIFSSGGNPKEVIAADLDGDGDLEIVTADAGLTDVQVFNNSGSGEFSRATTYEDLAIVLAPIAISDADAGTAPVSTSITVTNGSVTLPSTSGLNFTQGNGTADTLSTFTGTITNINTALASLQFAPQTNFNGEATIQITVNDLGNTGTGGPLVAQESILVTVLPVNDAPDGSNNTYTLVEDGSHTFAPWQFGFSDWVEADGFRSVFISTLPTNGTLALNTTTVTMGQEILNSDIANLVYIPNANLTGSAADSFTFRVRDDGGTTNAGTDTDPAANTITFDITGVNDAPELTGIEAMPAQFNENGAAIGLSGTITVNDIDNTHLVSATVAISGGHVSTEDVLIFNTLSGITGTFDSATGVLSLIGNATLSQYEAALRTITYDNTSNNPSLQTRTVSFVVNDGDVDSNVRTRDIEITPFNNAPALSGMEVQPAQFNEDGAPVGVLNFATQNGIAGSYDSATGILSLGGTATLAQYETALRTITYNNTSDNPSTQTRTGDIDITPLNDAPVLSGIELLPVQFNEDGAPVGLSGTLMY